MQAGGWMRDAHPVDGKAFHQPSPLAPEGSDITMATPPSRASKAQSFWRFYTVGMLIMCLLAAVFGQVFKELQLVDNLGQVLVDRMMALFVVALFLERAVEIYVKGSRRLGEHLLLEQIEEKREEDPNDKTGLRRLNNELARYKLETQRVAYLVSLLFGLLIAATGFRVLEGMMLFDAQGEPFCELFLCAHCPAWETCAWRAVDIVLTGGIIGGGAAGIHELFSRLTDWPGRKKGPTPPP
jgi:hypothetical protein